MDSVPGAWLDGSLLFSTGGQEYIGNPGVLLHVSVERRCRSSNGQAYAWEGLSYLLQLNPLPALEAPVACMVR